MPAYLENEQWQQYWNMSVFIPVPKKSNGKEFSNCPTIALISHASKIMLKILQARLQQYVTMNFQMFKLDLEKAEKPEFKLPASVGSSKARGFQKHIDCCFID